MSNQNPNRRVESAYFYPAVVTVVIVVSSCSTMLILMHLRSFEALKVVAAAFTTLLSTMLGVSFAFVFARRQMREQMDLNERSFQAQRELEQAHRCQELAFAMHREFSNAQMLQARTDASRLLEWYPDLSFDELYERLPEEQTRPLFLVAEFYDRLALSVEYRRIDLALVPQLFGLYYVWWWFDAFEQRLVGPEPKGSERLRLVWLLQWFRDRSSEEDFAAWRAASSVAQERDAADRKTSGAIEDDSARSASS